MVLLQFCRLFLFIILPVIGCIAILSTLIGPLTILFNNAQNEYKIIIRGIIWPIIVKFVMITCEALAYRVKGTIAVEVRNHGLNFIQNAFIVIGRAWITSIDNIYIISITCFVQSIWDTFVHRTNQTLSVFIIKMVNQRFVTNNNINNEHNTGAVTEDRKNFGWY